MNLLSDLQTIVVAQGSLYTLAKNISAKKKKPLNGTYKRWARWLSAGSETLDHFVSDLDAIGYEVAIIITKKTDLK